MFCTKCGTQNPEGAGFCVKCGAKLITDNPGSGAAPSPQFNASGPAQPVGTPGSTGNSGQQASSQTVNRTAPPVQQWSSQPQQAYTAQQFPVKKKSKSPFIVLGIVGGFFGLFVLIGIIGLITDSQDESSSNQQVSSTATSSAITASPAANDEVELTQTYFNSNEGIYFQYPGDWEKIPESDWMDYLDSADGVIAILARTDTTATSRDAFFILLKYEAEEGTEELLFSDDNTFLDVLEEPNAKKTSVTKIDGIPAREVTYVDEEGNGSQHYYYIIGSTFYKVEIDWIGEGPGDLRQTFDAIMDSYTIDEDKIGSDTNTDDDANFDTSPDPAPTDLELPEGLEWVELPAFVEGEPYRSSDHIEGVIQNNSGAHAKEVRIVYRMYDADGNQMDNEWDFIKGLENGNTWKFSVYIPSDAVR